MIRRALLAAILLGVAATVVSAQVQVSAQTARQNFLLYERIDVVVGITNISDTDIVLNNEGNQPWLSFMVSGQTVGQSYLPVHTERPSLFAPLTLKQGETKRIDVNITPLYSVRDEGNYHVSAVVNLPGAGQFISNNTTVMVQKGRTVASTVRTIDTLQRIYSLVRFSPTADETSLYLRVEAPSENVVYANVGLGPLMSSTDPQLFFDPENNVHVLQPSSLGSYLYTRANGDGKILNQRVFKAIPLADGSKVRPQLAKLDDGSVFVHGGLAMDDTPREKASDLQRGEKVEGPTDRDAMTSGSNTGAKPSSPAAATDSPDVVGSGAASATAADSANASSASATASTPGSEWAPVSPSSRERTAPASPENSPGDVMPAPGTVAKQNPNQGP